MKIGSLNDVIMEPTYNYINSIRLDENDPVVLLGEAALHKTLEYEDTSYLWEFAKLDMDNKWKHTNIKLTNKDNGKTYEFNQYISPEENHYHVFGPENIETKIVNGTTIKTDKTEFYPGDTRKTFRQNIDKIIPDRNPKYGSADEPTYNKNKQKVLDKLDSKIDTINKLSTEMQQVDTVKKEHEALKGFRDHIKNREFPKSWIAKKIAWFRSLYEKFMLKNKYAKDPGVIGWIKHVLACIAKIIDMLLAKLQHAVN